MPKIVMSLHLPAHPIAKLSEACYTWQQSPDQTSYAVSYLSRYYNKPMKSHVKMVKRVFQYLKGTPTAGIFFGGGKTFVAYTDSDFGGDSESGASTSGVLLMRDGPLVWYSQKQRLVATSTAEAEYRAAVSVIEDGRR